MRTMLKRNIEDAQVAGGLSTWVRRLILQPAAPAAWHVADGDGQVAVGALMFPQALATNLLQGQFASR